MQTYILTIVSISSSFFFIGFNKIDCVDVFCCYDLHAIEQSGQAVTAMLSLYRASQVMFPGETILEEVKTFSGEYLDKRKENGRICDHNIVMKDLHGEVARKLIFRSKSAILKLLGVSIFLQ